MDSRETVLRTLLYSEIFNYPLTKEEIYNFLIASKKVNKQEIYKILEDLKTPLKKKGNYFYLSNENAQIEKRPEREKISLKKIEKAKKIIKAISIIPTIRFIGISGALSMKNSDINDDIDIFIITKKNFVWTSRLFIVIILSVLGVYRKRNSIGYADKICLNLILDEDSMRFNKDKQNLFIAHEIVQMLPIFNKGKTYERFFDVNNWTEKFLPNARMHKLDKGIKSKDNIFRFLIIILFKLLFLENILRKLQYFYMKRHISKEIVKNNYLGFHPFDYEAYILKNYKDKLRKNGLK